MQIMQHNPIKLRLVKNLPLVFLLLTLIATKSYAQFEIPKKPKFQTSVYDYINLLSAGKKQALENTLIRYSDSTSTQIVIAIINSTEGEYINYLGAQWAEKWGIGQDGKDNGIFILLAKNDRKIGINTGKGVEHLLTDAMSRRIIQNVIIPQFKSGNYYGGLDAAANAIFKVMNGEYKDSRKQSPSGIPIEFIIFLIVVFIIIIISISKNQRGGGGGRGGYRRSTADDILETIILSNSGRRSGSWGGSSGWGSSGGSFGGGGFGGGFGGGSFGGGGASGGW